MKLGNPRVWWGLSWALGPLALSAQTLRNGNFEQVADHRFAFWEQSDAGVTIFDQPGAEGYHERITFHTGEYTHLRLYLRIQWGTGSVWFDHLRAPGLELQNPSFEEVRADGGLQGWGQDNVNQTIFSSEEWASDGVRSLLIRHIEPGVSRVWQDFQAQPNTDYVIEFDLRNQELVGDAYGEVYGMTPDGGHGPILGQSVHRSGTFEQRHGFHLCCLKPAADRPSTLSQVVSVTPGANLEASVWVNTEGFEGKASLLLLTGCPTPVPRPLPPLAGEGGDILRVRFVAPPDGQVRLTLSAQGTGTVLLDNVLLTEPQLTPLPQEVTWGPGKDNLALSDALRIALPAEAPEVLRTGVEVLQKALQSEFGLPVVVVPPGTAGAVTVEIDASQKDLGLEGYRLSVNADGATLTAAEPAGGLYGLMTVRNLLTPGTLGTSPYLPACTILDAPDLPLRGAYVAIGNTFDDTLRQRLDQFVTLKLNAVLFETPAFYHLDQPEIRAALQELFAYCRARHLEPIPELQSFGWAHCLLETDPHIAEGTWIEGEKVTLHGLEPTPLAHPNVLVTESTGITLTRADGQRVYREGVDYRVLPGETRFIFRPDAAPWRVARLEGGAIADGETVLASYDYASRVNQANMPYCPSEPRTRQMMANAVWRTVTYLRPRYLHIGHDEPAQMGTDSRCRKTGKSNARLFADDIRQLRTWARQWDPQVQLMMWADGLNPYHNAAVNDTAATAELIPKDVIQCVWFYGAGEPLTLGRLSLAHFARLGLPTTGSPWYDPACAEQWSRVCYEARQQGWNCLGTIYTSWDNRWEALETAANTAWRVPR